MITQTLNPGAFQGAPVYRTRSLWKGLGQDFIDTGGADVVPPDVVPPDFSQEPLSVPANSSPEGLPTTTTETPPSQFNQPPGAPPKAATPAASSSSAPVGGVLDSIGKFFTSLFSPSANPSAAARPAALPSGGAQAAGMMSPDTVTLIIVGSITVTAVLLTALLTRPTQTIVVASRGKRG